MGKLKVNLLGTSFTIQAQEDDEYLEKLLGYYSKIVDSMTVPFLAGGDSLQYPLQVAIMSGISLCDELYKEKAKTAVSEVQTSQSQSDVENADKAQRMMMEMIDKLQIVSDE